MLCVDEKSQIQALDRTQPIMPQVMGGHTVGAKAGLNGRLGERDAEMRLPHARRSQKDDVAGLVNEAERSQLSDLPLIDGRLESKLQTDRSSSRMAGGTN